MMAIKAIETEYKGNYFRSRLEARWAVFFYELGIEFDYEKEGYFLPDGEKYLPDFWLPEYDLWLEVKPGYLDLGQEKIMDARKKADGLCEVTGYPVFVTFGLEQGGEIFCNAIYGGGGGRTSSLAFWEYCNKCHVPALFSPRIEELLLGDSNESPRSKCSCGIWAYEGDRITYSNLKLKNYSGIPIESALLKARQARFEYGKKGYSR
jgi:hypothetical protein